MADDDFLTPEKFNFLDVLSGIAYPEDTVTIHTNEALAYQIVKLEELRKDAELAEDEDSVSKYDALLSEKRSELKNHEYEFHLRGISVEHKKDLRRAAKQKHADRKQTVQGVDLKLPSDDQNDWYATLVLHAQVVKIVQVSNGAVDDSPSPEVIHAFRNKAPQGEIMRLTQAVQGLVVAAEDFEGSLNETFL